MATILDVGLIKSFSIIFPVILVWGLVFTLLQKYGLLTKSVGINAIIAVVAAFMVLVSDTAIKIINFMIPWIVVASIFFILLLFVFMIFGAKETDIANYLKKDAVVGWVIIGVFIIIIVAAFGNVFGQKLLAQSSSVGATNATSETTVSSSSFEQNITTTLFNPKVLGLIILFAVAIFAVALLSSG